MRLTNFTAFGLEQEIWCLDRPVRMGRKDMTRNLLISSNLTSTKDAFGHLQPAVTFATTLRL